MYLSMHEQQIIFRGYSSESDGDEDFKRPCTSSSSDLGEMKCLLKELLKKVDTNERALKELQKSCDTASNTYVDVFVVPCVI